MSGFYPLADLTWQASSWPVLYIFYTCRKNKFQVSECRRRFSAPCFIQKKST